MQHPANITESSPDGMQAPRRPTGISPYQAMNAILKGEPRVPAGQQFRAALERRLRATERQFVLAQLRQALAWFASLLVLEGD